MLSVAITYESTSYSHRWHWTSWDNFDQL